MMSPPEKRAKAAFVREDSAGKIQKTTVTTAATGRINRRERSTESSTETPLSDGAWTCCARNIRTATSTITKSALTVSRSSSVTAASTEMQQSKIQSPIRGESGRRRRTPPKSPPSAPTATADGLRTNSEKITAPASRSRQAKTGGKNPTLLSTNPETSTKTATSAAGPESPIRN